MSLWRQLSHGLRVPTHRRGADKDVADEVRHFLEEAADESVARGLSPEEARRAARLEVGNMDAVREQIREGGWENVVGSFFADLRFALRMLRKSPGFTTVAVLTLALAIGANVAIFSVVKAVLLRSLPFQNADRLVMVRETLKNEGTNPVSLANFRDWQKETSVFEKMAAYSDAEFIVSGRDHSERIFGEEVTENYFEILGIAAVKGRVFLPEENRTPMRDAVALIGYGLWQRRFGSDPGIVGKQIMLNNANFTIVGVLPRGFAGLSDS